MFIRVLAIPGGFVGACHVCILLVDTNFNFIHLFLNQCKKLFTYFLIIYSVLAESTGIDAVQVTILDIIEAQNCRSTPSPNKSSWDAQK